jgi:hypothetical protein
MPVQPRLDGVQPPVLVGVQADGRALTRSGTSLVIRQTSRPSARRFSATTMIRLSLLSLRKPAGSTTGRCG